MPSSPAVWATIIHYCTLIHNMPQFRPSTYEGIAPWNTDLADVWRSGNCDDGGLSEMWDSSNRNGSNSSGICARY